MGNTNAGATIPLLAGLTNLRNLTLTFDNVPIALPALTLTAGGNLNVTAGGSITQTSAITVPGITTLATIVAGSDILLDTHANNFGGAVAFGGAQVNIRDIGLRNINAGAIVPTLVGVTNLRNLTLRFDNTPITLPSLTASGNVNAVAGGAITQAGAVTVAGGTTLAAGVNNITLSNAANNFNTIEITSGNNVVVTDINALDLGASTIGGTLNVTTGGALTQSGALNVTGATTLAAGANDIILNSAGNNFSAVEVTSGNNVTLTDTNALMMNTSTVSGNIAVSANDLTIGGRVVSAGGNMSVTGINTVMQSANLTAAGANTVTVTTTTGSITMAAAATTSSGSGTVTYYLYVGNECGFGIAQHRRWGKRERRRFSLECGWFGNQRDGWCKLDASGLQRGCGDTGGADDRQCESRHAEHSRDIRRCRHIRLRNGSRVPRQCSHALERAARTCLLQRLFCPSGHESL